MKSENIIYIYRSIIIKSLGKIIKLYIFEHKVKMMRTKSEMQTRKVIIFYSMIKVVILRIMSQE